MFEVRSLAGYVIDHKQPKILDNKVQTNGETMCSCCGSGYYGNINWFNHYNYGINVVIVEKDYVFPDAKETTECWIEEVPLDDNYKMLVKHRVPNYQPSDEDDEY